MNKDIAIVILFGLSMIFVLSVWFLRNRFRTGTPVDSSLFTEGEERNTSISLAEAYFKQGRLMEAMVVTKKVLQERPDDTQGTLLLAKIYFKQGQFSRAHTILHEVLRAWPDCEEAKTMDAHIAKHQLD